MAKGFRKSKRLKGLPINKMIPNMLTMLALCAGLTSIRWGLAEKWELAAVAILAAAILDGLDGRVARLLNGTSKFGAELDSLSDFVCFGVAPAILLYLWTMQTAGRFGWVLVLLFSVCCALRLARFNTIIDEPESPAWAYNYFVGVPSPAGAGLVMLPMILSFQFDSDIFRAPALVAPVIIFVSIMLVSSVHTYSFKQFKIPHNWVLPSMLIVGLSAAMIVSAPWTTLTIVLVAYLISMPFSVRSYANLKRQTEALQGAENSKT